MTVSHKLGPGSLLFGSAGTAKEFAAQCTNVRLEPSVDSEDNIPVLDGGEVTGDETVTWELSGTLLQSYDASSLIKWCYTNRLTNLPFVFLPSDEAADTWNGDCRIVPVTIGGDVKTRNTSDFTFRVIGEPTPAVVVP